MFYQFYFPETKFIINPVFDLPRFRISRDNWYKSELGVSRVLGELSRLGIQFVPEFQKLMEELS